MRTGTEKVEPNLNGEREGRWWFVWFAQLVEIVTGVLAAVVLE